MSQSESHTDDEADRIATPQTTWWRDTPGDDETWLKVHTNGDVRDDGTVVVE